MYEFIASGIQPAKPFESYMKGAEAAQNMQANKLKLESANIALEGAKKTVQAEKQWGALPRDEAGKIDPQAEQQFKSAFPDYYDTRKKAEVAQVRDQIGLSAEKFAMSASLFGKAKSPEDIAAAQKFAKDNFGMDIEYDPAVFGTVQKYSTELAQKSAMIREDMATAAAAGDYETVNKLQSALASETNLAALEVQKAQAAIARDRAAAASSNASAYKYYQQAQAGADTGPLEEFLDDNGNPVLGTRAQAVGKRPVPPAASLKDQLEQEKVNDAKSRVSGNLDALSEYYTELSNLGAAIDSGNDSVSNVAAAARASGIGQVAGRALGTKEQSVRNKINQMRPLLLQEIRQASAMGARGLDSNKELEFYLQAATDPSRDIQANMAALNVLSNAYGIGKPYGEIDSAVVGNLNNEFMSDLPLVRSAEDYAKLKPGTEYRDVTGKRGKKSK